MPVLAVLDAAAVRRWLAAARRDLTAHRDEIDALNVYPVPDGDTGTNLVQTLDSVDAALRDTPDDLVLASAVHAAMLGARGNSGAILAGWLRGFAEAMPDVAKSLRRAAEQAYAAVGEPVEGTILSVARAAADGAADADPDDLAAVMTSAATSAAEALRRTPLQLAKLSGLVDAGGRGLCVVLDALASVVTGRHVEVEPLPAPASRPVVHDSSETFAYEVMYLLDAPDVTALKAKLAALGDSLVVVGGDGEWNVHVHVDDVGAAIEAGVEAGRPHRITVTRFADQTAAPLAVSGRAAVAVVAGDGLRELYEAAGATVVGGGPSTGEILDAVLATGAAEVVVLPNDTNVHGPAAAAAAEARAAGRDVHVVPTRSPVQGLAALAVSDPARRFAEDAIAMSAAASATRRAEVTTAVRDAQTTAGPCRAGDVLGLVDGDVAVIGADVVEVGYEVLARMLAAGGELVTIIVGDKTEPTLGDALAERVGAAYPLVEVEVHSGGQPHYPLLMGVE